MPSLSGSRGRVDGSDREREGRPRRIADGEVSGAEAPSTFCWKHPGMDNPSIRRPYERPRLTVFGDLRIVTETNLTMNMNDPSNSSSTMT